jgi:hypothetical protein
MSSHVTDSQIKHLEFIQATVARLSNNSFLIRGWAITLTGVLAGLAINGDRHYVALAGLVPAISFWLLDCFYLRQERLYRKLYESVSKEEGEVPEFSMDVTPYTPSIKWTQVLFSTSLLLFYAPLIGVVIAVGSYPS